MKFFFLIYYNRRPITFFKALIDHHYIYSMIVILWCLHCIIAFNWFTKTQASVRLLLSVLVIQVGLVNSSLHLEKKRYPFLFIIKNDLANSSSMSNLRKPFVIVCTLKDESYHTLSSCVPTLLVQLHCYKNWIWNVHSCTVNGSCIPLPNGLYFFNPGMIDICERLQS